MASSSKNKFFFFAAAGLLLLAVYACSSEVKKPGAEEADASCKAPKEGLNPNGSSELAQLMRQMQSSADSARQIILSGGVPKKFPEAFRKIHTAKPTDDDTKKESFNDFATHYLNRLDLLYSSPPAEVRKNYTALIESCLSCHYDHCPGPIKAINKLKL
jgi:hypothetical protein